MTGTLLLVGVSMVATIFVLHIHYNGSHDNHMQMPEWVRKYVLHGLGRVLCMEKFITDDYEHEIKVINQLFFISVIHCLYDTICHLLFFYHITRISLSEYMI